MTDNTFKLQINFTKAYKGEDGNAYIEGIASGPEVDLTGERMSPNALESMVKSIQRRLVEFRDAHKDEWNDDLGEIVELSLTDDNHLFYKAKLDLNLSGAKDLWYRTTELGKKYGVSIGGSIVKAGFEYAAELGKEVFTYFDVDLHEISITRHAAYQYSFANAVLKSLPKKEDRMSKSPEVEKTEETTDETVTTQDTNLTDSAAAVETDAQEDAHEATQTEEATEESTDAAEIKDAEDETTEESEDVEKSTDATEEQSEAAAEENTQGVAKSAVFGDWAEINLVTSAISELSWTLQDHVWSALYNDEMTAAEKLSAITDGLDDFKALILKVATALVEDGNAEEVKRAASAFKATSPDAVSKSLTDKDTKVEELTKSLSDTTTELETTKKSLAEKETELEKINARKGIVFDKFGGQQEAEPDTQAITRAAQTQFAGFITGGPR